MRLTAEQIDRQYNARAAIPEHPQIFGRWARMSAEVRGRLRPLCDVRYGDGPNETLDLFSAGSGAAPALVFIHGGYWRSLDKSDFSFLAPAFLEKGVHFLALNYALAPAVGIEDIVRQMLRACAWIWRNAPSLGIDRNRIYLAGHSAGGHLVAMMLAADWPAYDASLPPGPAQAGLSISGLFDLSPLVRARFLQGDLRLTAASAERASPVRYLPGIGVRLRTAVGALESGEFKRQSRLIARAWESCFAGHVEIPGANHLTVVEGLADRGHPLFEFAAGMIGIG